MGKSTLESLEDFLLPTEEIKYHLDGSVQLADKQWYEFFITNYRFIAYTKTGTFFKRDKLISEKISDIVSLNYKERGLVSKKGILIVETDIKKLHYSGKPHIIKALWQELNKYATPKVVLTKEVGKETVIKEKEIITQEVVMIPCAYCGGLMPQTSTFCPECGARRKG